MALTESVKNGAVVVTEHAVGLQLADFAGLGGEVVLEKIFHTDFADEAYTHGFFLMGNVKTAGGGEGFDGRFFQVANREEGAGGGGETHTIEEVGLVFVGVGGEAEVGAVGAGVMTGGDVIGASGEGALIEELELDFLVAHNVGIGGAAAAELIQHIIHDFLLVGLFKIPHLKVQIKLDGDTLGVGEIFGPGTMHPGEIFGPVFHINTGDVVALVAEQEGGDGGINAAGHTEKDAFRHGGTPDGRLTQRVWRIEQWQGWCTAGGRLRRRRRRLGPGRRVQLGQGCWRRRRTGGASRRFRGRTDRWR